MSSVSMLRYRGRNAAHRPGRNTWQFVHPRQSPGLPPQGHWYSGPPSGPGPNSSLNGSPGMIDDGMTHARMHACRHACVHVCMQVGTTNGKERAAVVRMMVEDADAMPKRECFVRVSGIVKSLQGKLAVLDGEVELLWQIHALEKKDDMELSDIGRIQRCFGAETVLKREHAYEFDVPHTSAESREQWPCGDGDEVFRNAKDACTTGIKSLAFYPSLACIHLTIYFDGLCLEQDGLATGATPLNRRCLRLELVRNPLFPHVRFVANAAVVTRNKLRPLLPRVAASLVSPPSFLLTPELAQSWQMGPKPTAVQGVDFSGLFSTDALVLIVFQMRAQLVRVQVVLPGCVAGTLIFLAWSYYCAFAVRLTLLLGALMTFLLTTLNIMVKRHLLLSRYILTYGLLVLGVLAVAFVSIVASQNAHAGDSCGNIGRGGHQNNTTSFAAVESIWLGLHVLFLRACEYDIVRGTWEDCVAKAKLQSVSKPAQMLNPGTASLPRCAQELAFIEPSRNKVAPQNT